MPTYSYAKCVNCPMLQCSRAVGREMSENQTAIGTAAKCEMRKCCLIRKTHIRLPGYVCRTWLWPVDFNKGVDMCPHPPQDINKEDYMCPHPLQNTNKEHDMCPHLPWTDHILYHLSPSQVSTLVSAPMAAVHSSGSYMFCFPYIPFVPQCFTHGDSSPLSPI